MTEKIRSFLDRSHEHNDKDDFRTPPYLFAWINRHVAQVEYDGACTAGLNNLAKPLRLEDEWPKGSVVYSNPPFDSDSIRRWFEKGELHAENGGVHIMVLPNKICQVFFHPMIHRFNQIIFCGGRVNFESPYAVKGGTSMTGTIITVQGGECKYHDTPLIRSVLLKEMKLQLKNEN